jgi:hypothetical protein
MKKETVISELTTSRKVILDLLDGIAPEQMENPGVIENWSLKDLLVHLTRWEAELVKLLWLAKGKNQPTTVHFIPDSADVINERWFQESKSRSIDIVWKDFVAVREQSLRRVKEFSENELVPCFKRIRKSIRRWTKVGGRQGYLTYISQFM